MLISSWMGFPECINHFFKCSDALISWPFADPGKDYASEGWLIPSGSKQHTTNQRSPSSHSPSPSFIKLLLSGTPSPSPKTPQGQVPSNPRLCQHYSNYSILKLFSLLTLTCPFFSHGNQNKGSGPCAPLTPSASWLTLVISHVALQASLSFFKILEMLKSIWSTK